MRTIKLTLAYDGAEFRGWQVQPNQPTIQGALMDAVQGVTGERVAVDASGRTDAGVHALGQVASLRTHSAIPAQNLAKALNRNLPPSVRVLSAEEVPAGFHARFQARLKTYRYRIYRGPVCPPALWRYVHHFPYPLREAEMIAAAALFEGTHDFTAFASSEGRAETDGGVPEKSRIRSIYSSRLVREPEELVYTVGGSGFLHHMVRNIVGTLVEIGKGRMASADISGIMAARKRALAGPTLPGKGLWLVSVEY
jgi:tRNA pseudouridine38-40 synthase